MHIPDGYLSPSTCATLYAAASPFWYVALNKVKQQLNTRFIPLISVFSAFSFVIMMFNLPLPGGTTGHATGVGLASVVLGPWASMLAISIALMIQAVFFGDGGVLTLGANCFNIAIIGSLAAAGVNRLIAGRTPVTSRRRVWSAGLAGYVGINIAALLTAIQFGIQPELFKDAAGTPLYAPYPLAVAIPAMMLGHLTFAGIAEFLVSAGVVAYLQRSDPSLLRHTAPRDTGASAPGATFPSARRLWIALAVLMVLSPIGLVAVGSAWGEWAPEDFKDEGARKQIAAASAGATLPGTVPSGMQRLSAFWRAPIPDYAPALMRSPSFGYILSAVTGTGLILLTYFALSWIVGRRSV
ncbi:MAG: cobalt transporter CbiM [Bryobacteraceae bacterium]